jgi:release factor glutamine methyltransferase
MTVGAALAAAHRRLAPAHASARLDAELLLAHVLDKPRSYLFAHPEAALTPAAQAALAALIERRHDGEPVAYLLGRWGFWTLELCVTAATLIPRPETELLVELALARIAPDAPARIADLGTGSGAIALAIAAERPRARIVATDASAAALQVAQENARRLGLTNVALRQGSWYAPLGEERFDVIVSNPPYVAAPDPHLTQGDVRFEPRSALMAGPNGLDAIRALVRGAAAHLAPGGWLLVEHGYDQSQAVQALFGLHGFAAIDAHRDASGTPRAVSGHR